MSQTYYSNRKRAALRLIIVLLLGFSLALLDQRNVAQAQWTDSGANLTTDDNVGIGTTTPGSKLHVAGNIDTTDGADRKLTLRSSTNYNYALQATGDDFQIIEAPGSSGAVRLHIDYPTGNIGIGISTPDSTAKLHIVGNIRVDGNIAAKYQDVAEWVTSPKSMPAGTVVILDTAHSNQVLPSIQSYDTRVAGVISEMPGILLGEAGEGKVKVATTGRVQVRVDATKKPVQVGDLLVTSDKEGVAMKSEPLDLGGVPIHRPGTLIGKALEPLSEGEGEILVLLSLQ